MRPFASPLVSLVVLAGLGLTGRAAAAPAAPTLLEIEPGPAGSRASRWDFAAVGGVVVLVAETSAHGEEPWRTDGTPAGTFELADIQPSGAFGSAPSAPIVHAGAAYFTAQYGLWRTDGTKAGTRRVKDLAGIGSLASTSKGLFFTCTDDRACSARLWKSDGTEAGTVGFTSKAGGASGLGNLTSFVETTNAVYFTATKSDTGVELWKTDGTDAGTLAVKDVRPGAAASNPGELTRLGAKLVFVATTDDAGREPWVSDGTEAGTVRLADVRPGAATSTPTVLCALPNAVLFVADDGVHGRELWTTDGTAAGTRLLEDVVPGAGHGFSPNATSRCLVRGDKALFVNVAPDAGRGELWETDGVTRPRRVFTAPDAAVGLYRVTSALDGRWIVVGGKADGSTVWIEDPAAPGGATAFGVFPGSVEREATAASAYVFTASPALAASGTEPFALALPAPSTPSTSDGGPSGDAGPVGRDAGPGPGAAGGEGGGEGGGLGGGPAAGGGQGAAPGETDAEASGCRAGGAPTSETVHGLLALLGLVGFARLRRQRRSA